MHADPSSFPQLATERLLLRELTLDDAERIYEIHSNAEEMRWFGNDPMPSPDKAVAFIEGLAADSANPVRHLRWAIVDSSNPTGHIHGTCGLFHWNGYNKSCKVGYELHPESQGQGFMAEALRAAIGWAFEERKINRVVADIHADNSASRTLATKLGFVEEGLQRDGGFWGAKHHNLLLYSLLRRDADAHWPERAR